MTAPGVRQRWVDTAAELDALARELTAADRYALDTEFHGERSYFPRLALVQIAWDDQIALVDPLAVDPHPLGDVLRGPGTMVAHAGDQDLAILERCCGTVPTRYFDTQIAAGFVGLGTPALSRLAEQLLGAHLAKGDRLSDWTQRPLGPRQQAYAAADVEHLLALHDALLERLEAHGRVGWAWAECAERLARDRSPQDPDTAWWKIKGARSLRGKSRRVAQTVAAWRERTAQRLDLPPRFVLSDLALVGIVHRVPQDRADLVSVRGVDSGVKEHVVEELLAAVRAGVEMDDAALRLPPAVTASDRRYQPAVTVLGAWIAERSSELKLEPSLLGTRADLTELVVEGTGRLASGWRAEIAGEPIRRLLAGELCVVLDGGGSRLRLEERRPGPT
jgi:ribonuclease D